MADIACEAFTKNAFFFFVCVLSVLNSMKTCPFFVFPLSLSDCVFVFVLLPSSLRYHDKCVLELLERPLRRSVTTLVLIYSCFASRTFHLFFSSSLFATLWSAHILLDRHAFGRSIRFTCTP